MAVANRQIDTINIQTDFVNALKTVKTMLFLFKKKNFKKEPFSISSSVRQAIIKEYVQHFHSVFIHIA